MLVRAKSGRGWPDGEDDSYDNKTKNQHIIALQPQSTTIAHNAPQAPILPAQSRLVREHLLCL